jgi:hypothetical protein
VTTTAVLAWLEGFDLGRWLIGAALRIRRGTRLDIVFDGSRPTYLQEGHIKVQRPGLEPIDVNGRLYRVGVRNLTRGTVDDARVRLVELDPQAIDILPLTLHRKDDNPLPLAPYEETFSVHPGDREPDVFVDVLMKVDGLDAIIIEHIAQGVNNRIQPRRYRLTLRVSGRDSKPFDRHFIADLDDQGRLLFRKADWNDHRT